MRVLLGSILSGALWGHPNQYHQQYHKRRLQREFTGWALIIAADLLYLCLKQARRVKIL